jgi:hypothetical protein
MSGLFRVDKRVGHDHGGVNNLRACREWIDQAYSQSQTFIRQSQGVEVRLSHGRADQF